MDPSPSFQFNADRLVEATSRHELVIASTPPLCFSTLTVEDTTDLPAAERTLHFPPENEFGNNFAEFNGGTEDYRSSILMNRNAAGIEQMFDQQKEHETFGIELNHLPRKTQLPAFVPGSENHDHILPEYKDEQRVEKSNAVLKWRACANIGISKSKEGTDNVAKDGGNIKRVGLLTRGMGMLNFHMMQFTAQTFSGLAADVSCSAGMLNNEFLSSTS